MYEIQQQETKFIKEASKGTLCDDLLKQGKCYFEVRYKILKVQCPYAHSIEEIQIFNFDNFEAIQADKKPFKPFDP